jgi:uncharacterized repeat protein (TIGR02543 family)
MATLTATAQARAFVSDDFFGPSLNNDLWTVVDPVGGGSVTTDGEHVILTAQPGVDRNIWTNGNRSLRVMQPSADTDFEYEVKFETGVSGNNAMQGLIIEADMKNFLRIETYSTTSATKLFVASFVNGGPTVRTNKTIGPADAGATWLRVDRSDSTWTISYSFDGQTFSTGSAFNHTLAVTAVGPYAATATANPGHTAVVDYVFDTTNPIDPEDGGGTGDTHALTTTTVGNGTISLDPPGGTYPDGTVVTATATPDTGWEFTGWSGGAAGTTNPTDITITAGTTLTATFESIATTSGPTINVWYGDEQEFGVLGQTQQWVNVLGNVSDPDGVASLSYRLNGGASVPLSIGADGRRLVAPGYNNDDIVVHDLVTGPNEVELTAVDANGDGTSRVVTVVYTASTTWATDYQIDWSQVTDIQDVAQVVDGKWAVTADGLRTVELGYDRAIAIGDVTWTDYELTVPVTVHGWATNPSGYSGRPAIGALLRWQGHTDSPVSGWQPKSGWNPNGSIGWYSHGELKFYATSASVPFSLTVGETYLMKIRVETIGDGNSLYSMKAWPEGAGEPADWLVTVTEGPTDLQRGSLLLLAHEVDATFGDVSIQGLETSSTHTVATTTIGNGTITLDPSGPVAPGTTVTATATPDTGWEFDSWAGDASGTTSPIELVVDGDMTIEARFTQTNDTTPPVISDVVTTPDDTSVIVSWTTDEPTTGTVEHGLSTDYELGVGGSSSQGTVHEVVLTGLTPETDYHVRVTADDLSGNTSTTPDLVLMTTAAPAPGLGDDEFDGTALDTSLWSIADPVGDGTVTVSDGQLHLSIPDGVGHDAYRPNRSLRVRQSVNDTDYEIEVKFDSTINGTYKSQGLLFEQDDNDFVRFDFYSQNGTVKVFAATFVNGSVSAKQNTSVGTSETTTPSWMRVNRAGDTWTASYSFDGVAFTTFATFDHQIGVSSIGPFAGNAGANPEHTTIVDYFRTSHD